MGGVSTIYVILAVLACWRIGRLIAVDYITDPLRRWVSGTSPDCEPGDGNDLRPKIAYLFTCPWCISIWTSPVVLVFPIMWPYNDFVFLGITALAASGVTGMLATIEQRLDR